jgi:hypothetical protein
LCAGIKKIPPVNLLCVPGIKKITFIPGEQKKYFAGIKISKNPKISKKSKIPKT